MAARRRPTRCPARARTWACVALEKKPRTIEAVRVSLEGTTEVAVYDLALLTFG